MWNRGGQSELSESQLHGFLSSTFSSKKDLPKATDTSCQLKTNSNENPQSGTHIAKRKINLLPPLFSKRKKLLWVFLHASKPNPETLAPRTRERICQCFSQLWQPSNNIGRPELGIDTLEQKEDGKERLTAHRQYMQRKNI
jgi:hypothetical protein